MALPFTLVLLRRRRSLPQVKLRVNLRNFAVLISILISFCRDQQDILSVLFVQWQLQIAWWLLLCFYGTRCG